MAQENDPQLVNPTTDQPQYVVGRWIRLALIAVVNLIVLAALAAYFNNQSISLLDVISIIADAMGIVLGLLGIWFFFLSERLNRTTSLNIERTTSTVNDLRDQMWQMIQKTFNTFVASESKETVDETRQAIEQLREQINKQDGSVSPQVLQILEALNRRLDTIERQNDRLASVRPSAPPRSRNSIYIPERLVVDLVEKYVDEFPIAIEKLVKIFKSAGITLAASYSDVAEYLLERQFFIPVDGIYVPGDHIPGSMRVVPHNGILYQLPDSVKDRLEANVKMAINERNVKTNTT